MAMLPENVTIHIHVKGGHSLPAVIEALEGLPEGSGVSRHPQMSPAERWVREAPYRSLPDDVPRGSLSARELILRAVMTCYGNSPESMAELVANEVLGHADWDVPAPLRVEAGLLEGVLTDRLKTIVQPSMSRGEQRAVARELAAAILARLPGLSVPASEAPGEA